MRLFPSRAATDRAAESERASRWTPGWGDFGDLDLLGAEVLGIAAPSLDAVRSGAAVVRQGMQGEAVRYVQQKAGLRGADLDGDFGPKTLAAVTSFQRAMGLPDDGVVGKDTIEALDGVYVIEEKAPPRSPVAPAPKVPPDQGAVSEDAAAEARRKMIIVALGALAVGGIALAVATR